MRKNSQSTEAVAWMMAKYGRTQLDAAERFGISQGAISSTKAREDHAILVCEKFPDTVEKVCKILDSNPKQTPRGVAFKLGITEAEARSILLGLRVKFIRDEAKYRESGAPMDVTAENEIAIRHGYDTGRREMRETCAKIAEMVGGEHGAAVAASIRAVEV